MTRRPRVESELSASSARLGDAITLALDSTTNEESECDVDEMELKQLKECVQWRQQGERVKRTVGENVVSRHRQQLKKGARRRRSFRNGSSSAMKALLLLVSALLPHPSIAATNSMELTPTLQSALPPSLQSYRPPKCPCLRYQPWSTLTTFQRTAAKNLGYNANKWNHHRGGYNELEELYWEALSPEEQGNATLLGYDRHAWTCCANHYTWHHWGHMLNWWGEANAFYAILGYNKASWNRDFDYPPSEYKKWCLNVTNVSGSEEDACLSEVEVWSLKMVCYGSESIYRYDSLVDPVWGTYELPEHCASAVVEEEEENMIAGGGDGGEGDDGSDVGEEQQQIGQDGDVKPVEEETMSARPTDRPTSSPIESDIVDGDTKDVGLEEEVGSAEEQEPVAVETSTATNNISARYTYRLGYALSCFWLSYHL
mmetsp:Transcript_26586/g.58263  ORF Transcript_26586/g.58263 Transcript_26586/m.58263 type:complete len:428 (+) Transcript_26586:100-1383(+)